MAEFMADAWSKASSVKVTFEDTFLDCSVNILLLLIIPGYDPLIIGAPWGIGTALVETWAHKFEAIGNARALRYSVPGSSQSRVRVDDDMVVLRPVYSVYSAMWSVLSEVVAWWISSIPVINFWQVIINFLSFGIDSLNFNFSFYLCLIFESFNFPSWLFEAKQILQFRSET